MALSDLGLRRSNNQDSMTAAVAGSLAAFQQRGHLFMVADGMGAHAAGELASKLAVDTVPLSYHKLTDRSPPEALRAAMEDANSQIHSRGSASPDFKGMGTTSTVLVLLPQGAMVAQVGDSRAYRLRGNRYEQLTFDHSLVWEMRAAAQLSADQVPDYIPKNVITRSLGPNPSVQVDLEGPFPLQAGDTFLLCSDGLSGPVHDEEMGILLQCLPPAEAARTLVDLANLRGGPDNITVVIVRVKGPLGPGDQPSGSLPPSTRHPVHPAMWTVLGALVVIGLGLLAWRQPLSGLAALAAAALVGLIAAMQHYRGGRAWSQWNGQPLGRGPYTAIQCVPNAAFTDQLASVARQLRTAAASENWTVDWTRFNAQLDTAAAASHGGDHAQAVRQYAQFISALMAELKRQRRAGGTSGSAGE
ncbi:MAG: PP2C family protein-serine/threonine phosphatase [Thermoguttaceae bacterium]